MCSGIGGGSYWGCRHEHRRHAGYRFVRSRIGSLGCSDPRAARGTLLRALQPWIITGHACPFPPTQFGDPTGSGSTLGERLRLDVNGCQHMA